MVEGWLVDALWREQRVIVELDGHRAHLSAAQLERDHERDMSLRAVRHEVRRYAWRQVTQKPALVARDLEEALRLNPTARSAARGSR